MTRHLLRLARVCVALCLLALAACGNTKSDTKLLETTLNAYASTVRWSGILDTLNFVEPTERDKLKPSEFEVERWAQLKIGAFAAQPPFNVSDGLVRQSIQLDLINVNTQAVRSIRATMEWRYDGAAKRWWLTTGLPKLD